MIELVPGVHYRRIKVTINMSNGTCAYHLHKLEKEGLIRSQRDGAFKRFYPIEQRIKGRSVLSLSEIRQNIFKILQQSPGTSLSEIAYLMEQDVQKVDYHLKRMESEGIVIKRKNQVGHTMYFLRPQTVRKNVQVTSTTTPKPIPGPQPQTP